MSTNEEHENVSKPSIPEVESSSKHITTGTDKLTLDEAVSPESTTVPHPQDDNDGYSEDTDLKLTPIRAHYLKKTLITLQFSRELDAITASAAAGTPNVSTLSYLGAPFTPPPKGAKHIDLPFLKFMFRQLVMTFPFLSAAPKDFFPEKVQPFITSALERNFSSSSNSIFDESRSSEEDPEKAKRLKVIARLEKQFALLLGSATKLVEAEEVVRLTQVDLNRIEVLAKKRQKRVKKEKDVFEVNIVCVRAVVDKGRMRSKVHEEFIIRTRRTGYHDVFVSRRYGDFRTLAEELKKRYPDEAVRTPPVKDKSVVNSTTTTNSPSQSPLVGNFGSGSTTASPVSPRFPSSIPPTVAYSNPQATNSQDSVLSASTQALTTSIRLTREKNRLTLRSYLHTLLASPVLASSPVLHHFLLSSPTRLSRDEVEDARRREEADRRREEGRTRFAKEVAGRVDGLRKAMEGVKGEVMAKNGLTHIFTIIKSTDNVYDLPKDFQAVVEWGRISLASTLFQNFVAADDASQTFASLKRLHGLMPYFMLKGILRISNPVAMIRGILDLFLAQPFGGRSLLQRMFTSSLQEEAKALEDDIEAVKDKVDDPVICEKIRQFVYAPKEIQDFYKTDAVLEKINLLTVILRSGESPSLNRVQMQRVMRAHHAHAAYVRERNQLEDSDDDDGPKDDEAWLYEDLLILAKLYAQLRDREQLIELIFEGTTAELLKDIITIFYSPLAQVYKAASIADSLSDLQNFINDLIKTVEQVEDGSQQDPQRIVQAFVDLVQRHEQSFYYFVHKVHSKGEGLFDKLLRWIELFINLVRDGLGQQISLEFLLPHRGEERKNLLREVDEVALYHYKLKLAHEDKLRRRFGRQQNQKVAADAEDEIAQMLVNSVVDDLNIDDLLKGEVSEIAAAESDSDEESESDESDEESEYETTSGEEASEEGDENAHGPRDGMREREERDLPPIPPKPITRSPTVDVPPRPPPKGEEPQRHNAHDNTRSSEPDCPSMPEQNALKQVPASSSTSGSNISGMSNTSGSSMRSLTRSRSLQSLKSKFSMKKKMNEAVPPPPVPPLPSPAPAGSASSSNTNVIANFRSNSGSNLNVNANVIENRPSPLQHSSSDSKNSQKNVTRSRATTPSSARSARKRKGGRPLELKPPELNNIPNLLPVFVEIMRPLLRPAAI